MELSDLSDASVIKKVKYVRVWAVFGSERNNMLILIHFLSEIKI